MRVGMWVVAAALAAPATAVPLLQNGSFENDPVVSPTGTVPPVLVADHWYTTWHPVSPDEAEPDLLPPVTAVNTVGHLHDGAWLNATPGVPQATDGNFLAAFVSQQDDLKNNPVVVEVDLYQDDVVLGGVTGQLKFTLIDGDDTNPANNDSAVLLDNVRVEGGELLFDFMAFFKKDYNDQKPLVWNDYFRVEHPALDPWVWSFGAHNALFKENGVDITDYGLGGLYNGSISPNGQGYTYRTTWQGNGGIVILEVPEPATTLLLATGLVPLALRRRRRRAG